MVKTLDECEEVVGSDFLGGGEVTVYACVRVCARACVCMRSCCARAPACAHVHVHVCMAGLRLFSDWPAAGLRPTCGRPAAGQSPEGVKSRFQGSPDRRSFL